MKRGWKLFWVICGILAGIGLLCCIIGISLGATSEAVFERFPNGIGIVGHHSEWGGYDNGETAADTDQQESFSGIEEVDVDVTAVSLQILESETDEVRMETSGIDSRLKFQYYVDDGELKLETKKHIFRINYNDGQAGTIWLYLPKRQLNEVSVDIGAGELYVQNVQADSFSLNVGAGSANVDNFHAGEVDFDCGVGEISAAGEFREDADIKCGIGDVDLTVKGSQHDFDYSVKCGIGDVSVGDMYDSGLASKKNIDNGTGRDMDIKCGIGNVNVWFSQE